MNRPLLHYYLADHNCARSSSRGIWNVSRCLLAALARQGDPGIEICVSVDPRQEAALLPAQRPAWMRVIHVRGRRLWLDHVWCPLASARMGAAAVFLPKGWLPLRLPKRIASAVLLHDAMHFHYASRYPRYFPPAKNAYFRWATRHSFCRADLVLTNSAFTGIDLQRVTGSTRAFHPLPLGDPLPPPSKTSPHREGLLVLGSRLPHKNTSATLHLLDGWRRATGFQEPIWVAGDPSVVAGFTGVCPLGWLQDEDLSARYASVRALVHLSDMEGFGLPLLEAYNRGTPVVFRDAHAFHEVMGPNAPGAWDGQTEDSFRQAMNEVLTMPTSTLHAIADRLGRRYTWEASAQEFLAALLPVMLEPLP